MHKANEQVRSIFYGCDNLQAMKIMKDIEDRLQGKYQKSKGLPLSIEGHVHALIEVSLMKWTESSVTCQVCVDFLFMQEATSIDNLCRMYIGWAPYL